MVRAQIHPPFRSRSYMYPIQDLVDSGAHHFAETIRKIKQKYVTPPLCGDGFLTRPKGSTHTGRGADW